ncbi:type ISP restriction/modification enzyme [Bosea sp. (in: a-proteobacteria)]|uniref:type ISP restriction/modification enzyme n=1 Tax=Bosea sp. (in: a-proteobacteria) TaxID=1871050 RepID=UPI0027362EEB|nr:type ISP restriction/modification enzyme [Bosea sp. (in: a-proteobacteria)]MDP3407958.1 type ISP restriction/modification enzyme [Bosea sp. (in: a-proteobacteria)]
MKLFITDTLGNPFVEEDWLPQVMQPVAKSRRDANAIKKGQPITVVIGNPPYKEKAKGRGGWIEQGSAGFQPPMARWEAPPSWGVGAHGKHLKNLYVYFWRWATWKVFGSGQHAATGLPDTDEEGIICYITVAGFLNGPGFQKMRADLRESCSDIWVIDCSPEGHQPEVATRIFQGVQQPVCIVIAARQRGNDDKRPARLRYRALPEGRREQKFEALAALSLDDAGWVEGADGWRDSFLPEATGAWAEFHELKSIFVYNGSGVQPGRTWPIAPDKTTLEQRWQRLIREPNDVEKERLFHPHLRAGLPGDRHIRKQLAAGLQNQAQSLTPIINEKNDIVPPIRYSFRTFDRQWIVPDARLISQPNPGMWAAHSSSQIYLTALERASPSSGPALSIAGNIPDYDHYKGSFGGRVYPLWRDAAATQSNIRPTVLAALSETYGIEVVPEDVLASIAALLAHPAYTARFQRDLVQPGLRLPLTADATLFAEAAALGREVIWLHAYGERFADPAAGRPKTPPRLPPEQAPRIPAGGAIPMAPAPLPEEMAYDPATRRLTIGDGFVDNVMPEIFAYEVSGKPVLRQWFSYRRRDRTRPVIGDRRPPSPLDAIQPESWLPEYTTDLMNMLHVLGRLVLLEDRQAALLQKVLDGMLIPVERLGGSADDGDDSSPA